MPILFFHSFSLFRFCFLLLFGALIHIQANTNFKQSPQELYELANPNRLSHRIFYDAPSKGPHAKWFDAIKQGRLEVIKAMIDQGQDIEVKDEASLGQSALGWAAFIGYLDVVEYLVQKGANLYATDRADVTSVFKSAILGGNLAVIEYLYPLYEGKLDLNAQDERDGETALMVAAGNNRQDAVRFLLSKGANVHIISKQLQRNALSYACLSQNPAIIELITKAGGVNLRTNKPSCSLF